MVDAALIQQCADPALTPAIVETFIARAGSQDPLAITVRSGNRIVPVPQPTTPDEAMSLVVQHIGRNIVRVGTTQYPAGLDALQADHLSFDLVDACTNIRMGTALFVKVYRIVTRWHGNPTEIGVSPQVLDDAIIAWQTGYFEGISVFGALRPLDVKLAGPASDGEGESAKQREEKTATTEPGGAHEEAPGDPDEADIRIDLSSIEAHEK